MNLSWLFGFMLLSQQVSVSGDIPITDQVKSYSVVNGREITAQLPELTIHNIEMLKKMMDEIDRQVFKMPKNAIIDKKGNIIPEQVGYRLDREKFTEQVFSNYLNHGSLHLEAPLRTIYPEVDSELLGNIRSQIIGEYGTYFNKENNERNKNIYLAAEAINNTVLFPGEKFSFNQVVGKRTAEKGYQHAPVIINGELAEDIGGGICQVSSTLFNAVDNAGLKIINRYSHSKEVAYVPPGRDATVSWDGPDLVFKNSYNQPILIQTKTSDNKLTIEIYSSDVITYNPKKVPYLH